MFCRFLIILTLFLTPIASVATTWRVNSDPGAKADFLTFLDAHENASSGDSIYVEGSLDSYGILELRKSLTIIGTGYFLNENPETQLDKRNARFDLIEVRPGAESCLIEGIETVDLYIYTDSVTVQHTYISREIVLFDADYTILYANYINNRIRTPNQVLEEQPREFMFLNNYIRGNITFSTGTKGTIAQNTIEGKIDVHGAVIQNNILLVPSSGNLELVVNEYNRFNTVGFNVLDGVITGELGIGNFQSVPNLKNEFIGEDGNSTDGQWQLKENAVARGKGIGDTDCGMFGGAVPYRLSGMPSIPSIYEAEVPTSATVSEGLQITIKAKAH